MILRRALLAGIGTVATAPFVRKLRAAERLPDLASALQKRQPPVAPPHIVFTDAAGAPHTLEEFRGHGMVINLWATWCVPCVAEMPALETLSRALAKYDIAVLPLSSDRGGIPKITAFYERAGITALPILLDPKGAAGQAFGAHGIPTTLIIDRQGREAGRVEGAADWSSPQAAVLVRKLVD
jgi:thiol-disulfide isomerase/thioredoxin